MTATKQKKLSASMEDYLEAILLLIRQNRVARVRDIAHHLDVGMPAVTAALKALSSRKLVNYDPYEFITLTDRGRDLASQVSRRHHDLTQFLRDVLGIAPALAEANACRMEHAVDEAVLERLKLFSQFVARCPRTGESWTEAFQKHWTQDPSIDGESCKSCLRDMLNESNQPGDDPVKAKEL